MTSVDTSPEFVCDWPAYYAAVEKLPARDTLLEALQRFDAEPAPTSPRQAIDLGAGTGRDARLMATRGWRVTAVDAEPAAFKSSAWTGAPNDIERLVSSIELLPMPVASFHFVNSSFTLPFVQRGAFPAVWRRIVAAIRPGGRFAGQLFGERDTWAAIPGRSHHSRASALRLFDSMALERFDEVEKDGKDVLGNPKHFHVFHVIARTRGGGCA